MAKSDSITVPMRVSEAIDRIHANVNKGERPYGGNRVNQKRKIVWAIVEWLDSQPVEVQKYIASREGGYGRLTTHPKLRADPDPKTLDGSSTKLFDNDGTERVLGDMITVFSLFPPDRLEAVYAHVFDMLTATPVRSRTGKAVTQ